MLEEDGVDMSFEVVDGNQRLVERVGEGLSIADTHQQGARESWAIGNGYRVQVSEADVCLA